MKKLAILLALLLALSVIPMGTAAEEAAESTYEQTLFDRSKPIEINIEMDEATWNNMIATAEDEVYSACSLTVNGVRYENVAIRPKGNSSLSSVTSRGSERYSWRIKFDKYEKNRTCDGLDILILNNGFKDPGELREALAYDMYAFLNADASLYNYAIVSVNGEYFGMYLALEGVDESFAERNYGEEYGKLYKPELSGGNAKKDDGEEGDGAQAESSSGGTAPAADGQTEQPNDTQAESSSGGTAPAAGDGAQGFGFDMGGGAKSDSELAMALNYVGDDLETYQGIWDSAKFKSNDEDHARVVEAIKHVCQGDGIADYLFVDNVLKYFAIQTFIYNHDGLTGTVSHNYYLYEQDGKLNLIPWDMNESFTVSGNGSDYVNFPIDTPFTVSDLGERSFFMALLENEECCAKYHEYLRQLSEEYALGGRLEETINRIRTMIDAYVETDPTAFSTYAEYDSAAKSLQTVIELRAQSVLGQLSGEIPSTRDGQSAEPEKLLDTSGADLSGLTGGYGAGQIMMGGFPF